MLLNVDTGTGETVEKELEAIEGITEMTPVYGVNDYFLKVETIKISKLKEIISQKIQS